jgi:endo-1,4-beta-xylanase
LPAMGTGGQVKGGTTGTAGNPGGGSGGSGGTSTSTGTTTVDCSAAMPTGGQSHSGNSQGGTGNLAWQIWSNQGSGTMTTFSTPAFTAAWNNSGDYLGRLGYEWGNGGKTYDQYGKITADFTFKKTGSGGGFSYIGIYGWSTNPCTEWYIIDDSFGSMPFNPYGSSQKGTATIDGETYKLFSNNTTGTGGSRCNASSWLQHWSVRQKARQCGTITVSEHFKAWDAAGMKLGNLLEVKILVETGGGSGNVEFPIAKVGINQ